MHFLREIKKSPRSRGVTRRGGRAPVRLCGGWRGPLRFLFRLIGSAPCKCPHLMDAGCRKRYGLLHCKIIVLSSRNLLEATRHAPFPHSWRRTEYSSSSQPEIDVDSWRRRICVRAVD